MRGITLLTLLIFNHATNNGGFFLPIQVTDRHEVGYIELTAIGQFGLLRKARPGIPAHLHTGIDFKRPTNNYDDEPIFPIAQGTVISKRDDGPYAQLIIEHEGDEPFWTVYEHIAGIEVALFEPVTPDQPIARFMNLQELDRYGWQFDHFHFEVLKAPPIQLKVDGVQNPERLFASHTLTCYTEADLAEKFYDPMVFLKERLK